MALEAVAGEIILPAAKTIGGYTLAHIGYKFQILTRCKKNLEMVTVHIQRLGDKRDGVQHAVNAATMNGQDIKPDVRRWLTDVETIMAEAGKLDGEIDAKKRYLKWWHPNLRLRYKLSKEALRISYIVMGLYGGGIVENVSVPAPPPGVEAMPAFLPTSVLSMSVSLPAPPPGIEIMSSQDFVAFESTKLALDQIFEALKDESCNMVGLYGMGGVGKTTLVKEVGKKVKEQKLFDQVVFAVVSKNAVIRNIQVQIAEMLGLTLSEESDHVRAGRLYARLKKEKTALIILDDVWARLDLKAVGIPHGVEHEGCKIILTTRRETICNVMGIQTKKIPVNVLPNNESWDLFGRQVGVDIESSPLNVPARAVVGKCKGLPIALVTIGRALRNKDLEEWNVAIQQLKTYKGANIEGMDQDVFSCIRVSYDYLSGEETKLCFLLCCLFPEDYNIEIEYLARYANGKGLIKNVDTMEEARSQVHYIIKNLKASCMLLDSGEEDCVKMHDIIRDAAISIASGGNNNVSFLVRAGAGLKKWPQMESFQSYSGISLMKNDFHELPEGLECPNLQILLLGENEGFDAMPEAFFEGMGMLKVLDLSGGRILSLPSSIKFLVNLRTLHLRKCKLGNLSALGMLKKLEILSFVRSNISALPEEIGELINLRLLDLTLCGGLKRISPNVISKLTRLEELYMGGSRFRDWEVEGTTREERRSASLSELKLLLRLTILCIQVPYVACFPENFLSPNLQKFEIEVRHDWNYINFRNYYTNSNRLYLECDEVPSSDNFKILIQMVEELTLCKFKMRGSCDNILAGLAIDAGGLNGLKSLKLSFCDGIESLINYTNQWKQPVTLFANLEKLHLSYLENMEVICRGGLIPDGGSFEKLRVLKIEYCLKLQAILVDLVLHRLKNLEEVSVVNCYQVEVIFQVNEEIVAEHANNLVPLLSSLRKLELRNLPELLCIWKWNGSTMSTSLVSLCNLTFVEITGCEKLRNLFSPSLAQGLLNLETLKIERCENLETIIVAEEEEDQEGRRLSNNNCVQPPVVFPKLKVIEVQECNRLMSLFTIATARSLVKLQQVELGDNKELLEIVCHDGRGGEEEGDENKEIFLPQLHKLDLYLMPKFERLCPGSFNMDLPSLEELEMTRCPMLKDFAADATAYGLKSAPKLVKVEVDYEILDGAAIQNLFSKQGELQIITPSK